MKTVNNIFKHTFFCLALGTTVCSCDLDVEPTSSIATETFWTSEKDAWYNLNAVYSASIPGAAVHSDSYTNDAYCQYSWESNGAIYQQNGLSALYDEGYNFETVRKQNIFLQEIENVPMDEDLKTRFKAEVRAMRAWTYLNLTTTFGKVPLITDVLSYDAPNIPRDETSKIREFILNELTEAAAILPEKYAGSYQTLSRQTAALQSAADALQKQMCEADKLDEAVILERKGQWVQKKTSLENQRSEQFAAYRSNRGIYESAAVRQKELLAVEAEYIWMRSLADTANGGLAGKRKIELETYIQMAYFDRIIRRANLRLMTMSSGQYELKRQEDGESKKEKAGLELNVIDHYNGTERSVKTLSGGESFQASLSLALGLSDEIQSCAGGIRLDTMFVDEGFGSLDEEALQAAMRALQGLAEGDRLVGIISHVSELKERIESKIVVTKCRNRDGVGSRVKVVGE